MHSSQKVFEESAKHPISQRKQKVSPALLIEESPYQDVYSTEQSCFHTTVTSTIRISDADAVKEVRLVASLPFIPSSY